MGCLPYNHRLKSTKIKHSFIFKALELVFLTGMRVLFVKQNHFSIFKLTFLLYGIYPHSRQEREKSSVKKKLRAILCIFSISILHSLREPGTKSRPFGLIWAKPRHLQTWQGYPRIRLDLRIMLVPLKIWNSVSGPSQSRKTGFLVLPYCGSTKAPTDICRVPADWA